MESISVKIGHGGKETLILLKRKFVKFVQEKSSSDVAKHVLASSFTRVLCVGYVIILSDKISHVVCNWNQGGHQAKNMIVFSSDELPTSKLSNQGR